MGSFGGMSRLRTGYWYGIRNYVLREGVDVGRRVASIGRERQRIGFITVTYAKKTLGNGSILRTEQRIAVSVTPDSSLEKLVQSYVMMGGNILDVSMFMCPDMTILKTLPVQGSETVVKQKYPYDGVVAPVTTTGPEATTVDRDRQAETTPVQASDYSAYPGGKLNLKKYQADRIGGQARLVWNLEHTEVSHTIHKLRGWCNQEIAEKLHLIEHRIIKLMDLREQLWNEYYYLLGQAWAGTLAIFDQTAMPNKLTDASVDLASTDEHADNPWLIYVKHHTIASIVSDIDHIFYDQDETGATTFVPEYDELLVNTHWAYGDLKTGEEVGLSLML